MSATPQDVQTKISQAETLLKQTTSSGTQTVNKYGSDPSRWPTTTKWRQAFDLLAAASAEAGQLLAPPPLRAGFTSRVG